MEWSYVGVNEVELCGVVNGVELCVVVNGVELCGGGEWSGAVWGG